MRGAHQLFVEMSRLLEANAGAFLCVTVTHMLYRGTEEVRHQVYHVYGADNLVVFARAGYVEALVGFLSGGDAEQARPPMDAASMNNCCVLDVLLMPMARDDSNPTSPCNSVSCSRHNSDIPEDVITTPKCTEYVLDLSELL
jgi:hypothetical protein